MNKNHDLEAKIYDALDKSSEAIKMSACYVMGVSKIREALCKLQKIVENVHTSPMLRYMAILALREMPDVSSIQCLAVAVQDVTPSVRSVAVATLGDIMDLKFLEPLLNLLLSESERTVLDNITDALDRLLCPKHGLSQNKLPLERVKEILIPLSESAQNEGVRDYINGLIGDIMEAETDISVKN